MNADQEAGGAGGREVELEGFVTRHQLSLAVYDWRTLPMLLDWLQAEEANLIYLLHRQAATAGCDMTLMVEGLGAPRLRCWIDEAKRGGLIRSARLEHFLTRVQPVFTGHSPGMPGA